MRLNRVLQLNRVPLLWAATISILMLALAFTISCSGDNGPRGKAGEGGCHVEQNTSGDWDIFCDDEDEPVGQLYKNGKPGKQGSQGAAGDNCWLGPLTANGYEILCGTGAGTSKGFMSGCTVELYEENPKESAIICGKNNEIHLCGTTRFEPANYECNSGGTLDEVNVVPSYCGKDRVLLTKTQYCGYAEGDDVDKPPTTPYEICGDDIKLYEDGWVDDVYCRYTDKETAVQSGEAREDFCDGQKINENSWKGQYCGWASRDAAKKTLLTGACDEADDNDIQGPNEVQFGIGYCVVEINSETNKPKKTTKYTEKLCGSSANNKPNNGKWNDEYCGFASAASAEKAKVYTGLCTDRKGPHEEKFNAGYCAVDYEQIKAGSTARRDSTTLIDFPCDDNPDLKPNEGSWKGEYCGFDSTGVKKVRTGICDDGEGPSQDAWNSREYCATSFDQRTTTRKTDEYTCDDGTKPNEGKWKYEYCGYASKKVSGVKTPTTKRTNGCDDGDGPDIDDFGTKYCRVLHENKTTGYTVTDDEFCGNGTGSSNRMNEGSWKNEYCGYKDAKSEDNDKIYNDMCDDGQGPFDGNFPAAGYCQWSSENAIETTLSSAYCQNNKTPYNKGGWKGEYCFADDKIKTCVAGTVAVRGAKSTDPGRCANRNVIAACDSLLLKTAIDGNTIFGDESDLIEAGAGYKASISKCAYNVEAPSDDADDFSALCPRGTGANNFSRDAAVYVECVFKYEPGTTDTEITSTKCKNYKRLNGSEGIHKSKAANSPALCLAKNTLEECLKTGNAFKLPVDDDDEIIASPKNSDLTTTTGAWTLEADEPGRCEFTPPLPLK